MKNLFTKQHLLEALKVAKIKNPEIKIGATYMSLLKYEVNGVIGKPSTMLEINGKEWRFYSKEEIDENVQKVITHKS